MNRLVRNLEAPEDAVVLNGTEALAASIDTIILTAGELRDATESDVVLDKLSDIMEMIQVQLGAQNVDPVKFFEHASNRRAELGTFQDKKSVQQEQ